MIAAYKCAEVALSCSGRRNGRDASVQKLLEAINHVRSVAVNESYFNSSYNYLLLSYNPPPKKKKTDKKTS